MDKYFWTMDKGVWQSDAIFHSRDGKKTEEERRRKDIIFLEKTRTFCNKKMPLVFPEVFCFCGRRTKGGISCSKEQASPSNTSSNTSKENKGSDMSMEKSPSLSRKRKISFLLKKKVFVFLLLLLDES